MTETTCQRPHQGWWCSRARGHDGPCAARPLPMTPDDLVTLANVPGGLNDQLRAARDHLNRTYEGENR